MLYRRWVLPLLIAAFATHSFDQSKPQEISNNIASNRDSFTSESLGMPRTQIILSDRMLRIFNGRGAISLRDKTVTGLQRLQFPPIEIHDYNFSLSFRNSDGVLIQDTVPDYYESWVAAGSNWDYDPKLKHPLGLNTYPQSKYPQGPWVVLLQSAFWEPNLFRRTGTFNTVLNGHLVSFAIKSEASTSAEADEVYLKVEISNRESVPLDFTVIANQRAPSLKSATHPDAYTLAGDRAQITVVSDLDPAEGGWHWEIPGHATKSAYFALILQKPGEPNPKIQQTDLAARAGRAKKAIDARLQWASSRLPEVSTGDPQFDDLYRRCIFTILESRWDSEGVPWRPFYAVGSWIWAVPWDLSYTSEGLSILDPDGLRENLLADLRADTSRYVFNRFALMRVLKDYMRQTGDVAFLDHKENGKSVFEIMKERGEELEKNYKVRSDGLLDFGAGQQNFLEMRTDGYEHAVPVENALAVTYFRKMAEWCRERNDPDASLFEHWADEIQPALSQRLWDPAQNWFVTLAPDNSATLVWTYHEFDMLDTGLLSRAQEAGMISHLKEGEFLAPYGIYSVSKTDTVHWDLEDVDWGGGGQYTGEPLRLAESLYRLGHAELAWDILSRCTRWTEHYPYIPQEIFGDFPGYPEVEMPAALAAGTGVQTIIFGVFGLRPQQDGSVLVSPSYHHELGRAILRGYSFRGHTYDVEMDATGYRVFRDGKLAAKEIYGDSAKIPE